MKLYLTLIAFIISTAPAKVLSQEQFDFSGNVEVVSDYVYRGISQTDENPALQGNIDLNYDDFKVGVWGSNVDFGEDANANIELDFYTAYTKTFDKLSWENGLIYYFYPGAESDFHLDYGDIYSNVYYDFDKFEINAGLTYSPDFSGNSGETYYPNVGISFGLLYDLKFKASMGRQIVQDNINAEVPDYTDWGLELSYPWEDFTIKLKYADSDIEKDFCPDICGARGIISVAKAFP